MALIVKVTPQFEKLSRKLLSEEAREALYDYLEAHPEAGDIISGTGGVRKLRWRTGKDNKGKRGGVRILYHYTQGVLILLITLYSKSEKGNITQAEKKNLKKLVSD